MRRTLLLFLFLLLTLNISAECKSGQIDINSASLEELDQLSGIGPVKAQAIIDARPFDSIDELIDIVGIGEITLEKIKSQGLACVDNKEEREEDKESATKIKEENYIPIETENIQKTIELEKIILAPKSIKTEEDNKNLNKNNYTKYGLIAFCALLFVLFLARKKKYKNEFR